LLKSFFKFKRKCSSLGDNFSSLQSFEDFKDIFINLSALICYHFYSLKNQDISSTATATASTSYVPRYAFTAPALPPPTLPPPTLSGKKMFYVLHL
jgi:hypothetical protein